jgi:hypothetical protein
MFRGKGFKTSFHGWSSVMSTISQVRGDVLGWCICTDLVQFREVQAFTREALTVDHSIMRIRTDFKTFRDRRKAYMKQLGARTHGTDEEVFEAVPDRSQVDALAVQYFQKCETTYRVLHEPSFWKEYQEYWHDQPKDPARAGFAVILVLIVAFSKCLSPKDDHFVGDTTVDRQAASNLIDICDTWIRRQPRKRLTLQFFQLQCLSLLAKRVNCVSLKQDWLASGDLVRLALASGLHRDPSLLATGKISPFEKEMKKRLWATIVELELQSSLESGIQSSLTALYWDTSPPANLADDAFSSETEEMPASRPLEHFTSVSYLRLALQSLPLRIRLAHVLNDPSNALEYSDVLHYDAQIHELLSDIPLWDDSRSTIPSALLRLQLRQFLLILHKPYAKVAFQNQRFMPSFTQCVDAGSAIVTMHDELLSQGVLVLNNLRNDVIRVGITLSQIVYHNCTRHGPIKTTASTPRQPESHFSDPQAHIADLQINKQQVTDLPLYLTVIPRESFLARTLCTSALEVLELAGQVFEQKVMRIGTGYMEYWLLSAAIGMLPPAPSTKHPTTSIAYVTNDSDDIHTRCKKTLDRFQTLAFRVLALQKDPENTFASSLRHTMADVSPSNPRTPSVVSAALPSRLSFGTTPTAMSDSIYSGMPSMNMGLADESGSKDFTGTFDTLQDMQPDLGGWNFPDFWAFDLGGDF